MRDRITWRNIAAAPLLVFIVVIPPGLLGAVILGITQLTE